MFLLGFMAGAVFVSGLIAGLGYLALVSDLGEPAAPGQAMQAITRQTIEQMLDEAERAGRSRPNGLDRP